MRKRNAAYTVKNLVLLYIYVYTYMPYNDHAHYHFLEVEYNYTGLISSCTYYTSMLHAAMYILTGSVKNATNK